jgi:hypothetical protein
MRRGSMRNVSPRGFASLVEIGVAPADKPERSDLFNPLFQKSLLPQGFAANRAFSLGGCNTFPSPTPL